jgi:hypothetical protein
MLVRTHNGGVEHHVFVIVIAPQLLENSLKNPALRPSTEPLVDNLPITKPLGQIPPRNTGPISVDNSLNKQSIIRRRAPDMPFAAGQKILDPIPLVVA